MIPEKQAKNEVRLIVLRDYRSCSLGGKLKQGLKDFVSRGTEAGETNPAIIHRKD